MFLNIQKKYFSVYSRYIFEWCKYPFEFCKIFLQVFSNCCVSIFNVVLMARYPVTDQECEHTTSNGANHSWQNVRWRQTKPLQEDPFPPIDIPLGPWFQLSICRDTRIQKLTTLTLRSQIASVNHLCLPQIFTSQIFCSTAYPWYIVA
jgi:hypothetical protein